MLTVIRSSKCVFCSNTNLICGSDCVCNSDSDSDSDCVVEPSCKWGCCGDEDDSLGLRAADGLLRNCALHTIKPFEGNSFWDTGGSGLEVGPYMSSEVSALSDGLSDGAV